VRFNRHRRSLSTWFLNRSVAIEGMTACAAAQEPPRLCGPLGTAKIDLVRKWVESVGRGQIR
jgi:hypothetical protein